MVTVKRSKHGIKYYQKWFYSTINPLDVLKFVAYRQLDKKVRPFCFKEEPFYTIIVSLKPSLEKILENFTKETQYEIRRAERDGIKVRICNEEEKFIEFFNSFANERNLTQTTHDKIDSLDGNKLITEAHMNEQSLAFHLYICDGKIARLLYSATRVDKAFAKSVIGRANRYLHYEDIRFFKEHDYEIYDLGGYAKDTQDPKLHGINDFKESFGGTIVEQYNYYSPLYALVARLIKRD